MKLSFLFGVLLLLCLSAAGASASVVDPSSNRDFDWFYLVRQWPAGFCSEHSCPRLHVDSFQFTIHGLWPNFDDGTYPQFCDKSQGFSEAKVHDLEPKMEVEWPSFSSMGNIPFWQHEWEKHGTCALSVLPNEHEYFENILALHEKLSLTDTLRSAGICPSNSQEYNKKDILGALNKEYGINAQIHCIQNTLVEVWMCVDKDLDVFSCPHTRSAYQECPDFGVLIPPLHGAEGVACGGSESSSITTTAVTIAPQPHSCSRSITKWFKSIADAITSFVDGAHQQPAMGVGNLHSEDPFSGLEVRADSEAPLLFDSPLKDSSSGAVVSLDTLVMSSSSSEAVLGHASLWLCIASAAVAACALLVALAVIAVKRVAQRAMGSVAQPLYESVPGGPVSAV